MGDQQTQSYSGVKSKGKILCFGELLLRMSPATEKGWIHEASMPIYVGGAELNVAKALASWELQAKYFSAMPDNYMAHDIKGYLDELHIDTTAIRFLGNRIGLYYLPQGTDLKNAGVIYDRAHSSFADLKPGEVDWDAVMKDCSWFHFSAISPALTQDAAAVCKEAVTAAATKGLTISIDLNYRGRLWKYGQEPVSVMPGLLQYAHVVMGNIWSAESLLGIPSPIAESTGCSKDQLISAAAQSFDQMQRQYPGVHTLAYTFRLDQEYFAVIQQDAAIASSGIHSIGTVIDKVGSGDCFMAGLIYGLYNGKNTKEIIDFAAAAAVGKLYEKGDATRQTIASIVQNIKNGQRTIDYTGN